MFILHRPLSCSDQAEIHVIGFGLINEQLPLVTGYRWEASLSNRGRSLPKALGQGIDVKFAHDTNLAVH